MEQNFNGLEIAVIGLSCRFPGASTVKEYWHNLKNGVDSIQYFTEKELIDAGVDSRIIHNPNYVNAKGYMNSAEEFDAGFFGYAPIEARMMDPQMRVFHECVWEALEDSGYASRREETMISLYAGASPNHNWEALMSLSGENKVLGHWAATQLMDKDYLATRIAHKLNLKGTAMTIYTACSTSLVAVHTACQSLLNGECDIALAGGVSIALPAIGGYLYQEGMILSPDGKCRAFDGNARGTVGGDGAGVVVLKRLSEAIKDHDNIYAIVKGSAVNNDGSDKTGFTSPSIRGQAEVIRTALKVAEVSPESIDVIECHGTGTPLGDMIELDALEMAYKLNKKGKCAIGSVKTNVGHLDSAAGIAAFIKSVLMVKYGVIPPTLNYQKPNDRLRLFERGFYVNDRLRECKKGNDPMRAGVSAFGIGGTNVHIIVEQLMEEQKVSQGKEFSIVALSAQSKNSLMHYKERLNNYIRRENEQIEDIAYTLLKGRMHFAERELVICSNKKYKINLLEMDNRLVNTVVQNPDIYFVFHGFTNQKAELESLFQLCAADPVIKNIVVEKIPMLDSVQRIDAGQIEKNIASEDIDKYLLTFYYAIAKYFINCGVVPAAVSGYGKGELTAALIADAITYEEAIEVLKESRKDIGKKSSVVSKVSFLTIQEMEGLVMKEGTVCIDFELDEDSRESIEYRKENIVSIKIKSFNQYAIVKAIGLLWLQGVKIDWRYYYRYETRKTVSLPTYVFDHEDYHIGKEDYSAADFGRNMVWKEKVKRNTNIKDWFYVPAWECTRVSFRVKPELNKQDRWLIFEDKAGVGSRLSEQLHVQNVNFILVRQGEKFEKRSFDEYSINPYRTEEIAQLFSQLDSIPENICYMWALTTEETSWEEPEQFQKLFLYNILKIVQCIGKNNIDSRVRLLIASNGMYSVTGDERLYPAKALLLGAVKIIPFEYPGMKVCNVDFIMAGEEDKTLDITNEIIKEFGSNLSDRQVAYRRLNRYTSTVKRVQNLIKPEGETMIDKNPVCLITGGLGGMGLTLAEYLARYYHASLILVGRSYFPLRENWAKCLEDEPGNKISRQIETIMRMEQYGAKVQVYRADISDINELKHVVLKAEECFGPINGVLHTAGVADFAGVIQRRTKEETEEVLRPKVKGTIVLDTVLSKNKLDFFILFSSIGNYIYGRKFGQVGYNAANEFLDAYALYRMNAGKGFTASINWNDWSEVGMSVTSLERSRKKYGSVDDTKFQEESISPEEGVEIFQYIIENQLDRVIISAMDLPAILETCNTIDEDALMEEEAYSLEQKINNCKEQNLEELQLEEKLGEIWKNVLGVKEVCSNDDFFRLGGDSLKGITILSYIYKKFGVKINLPVFFQNPTIQAVASVIQKSNELSFQVIPRAEIKEAYYVTSMQKSLYAVNQLNTSSRQYNNIIALNVSGVLDYKLAEECLKILIRRHESLRTSFHMMKGEVFQIVEPEVSFKLEYLAADGNNDIEKIIDNWEKIFDLSKAPLIEAAIIKVNSREHVIVLNTHHIITDGSSSGILLREFMALYENKGNKDCLQKLSIQYKDYAQWRKIQEKEEYEKNQSYWAGCFKGELPLLNLPVDFIRPAYKTYKGSVEFFHLDKRITGQITKFATDHGVTVYMFLFTVWNVFLSKMSSQRDIIVGVPVAGRDYCELQNVVGMFANTLPIRSTVQGQMSFVELMEIEKENITNAMEHQFFDINKLVQNIGEKRDFGRNPLYDVIFIFQNTIQSNTIQSKEFSKFQISRYEYKNKYSRFDLTLDGELNKDGIMFGLEYSTDLFQKDTILRFIKCIRNIIYSVLNDNDKKIEDISGMDLQEKELILNCFNQTKAPYQKDITIHQLFEEQVRKNENKAALIFENKIITYKELNKKANRIAWLLRGKGVEPDQIVTLMATRSIDMIAGILAILKASCAYLPVDPNLSVERVKYMMQDCSSKIVLTNTLLDIGDEYEIIEMGSSEISLQPEENLPNMVSSRNLSYCIYTSGTTGHPKGIEIEHRGLVNFAAGVNQIIQFDDHEIVLSLTTISFDMFWTESIMPLIQGFTSVLANDDERMDPLLIGNLIKDRKVTLLQTTPSRFRLLISASGFVKQIGSLKNVMIGGEVFPLSLIEKARNELRGTQIYNLYGPTETTVFSTMHNVTNPEKTNIGRPIQNTQIYILNDDLQLVPIGVAGVIYIGGDGLARGYRNKPELTKEKFIDNPYRPGEKIYCSGDLGKWRQDGTIDFLGRNDFQIKIRGFRIEVEEIEQQLQQYPEIQEAVVVAKNKNENNVYLAAFYTAESSLSKEELSNYLKKKLPDYMIPQYYIQLNQFELNINGKINRASLPEPVELQEEYVAPGNDTEKQLFSIWKNVIGTDKIGITQEFFALGGNSIQVMKVIYEINAAFQTSLSFKEFIELQTIKAVADFIDQRKYRSNTSSLPVIVPDLENRYEPFPMTNVQLAYYLGRNSRFELGGVSTHSYQELVQEVEIDKLEKCLNVMISRHPMLRTIFLEDGRQQVLKKVPEYHIKVKDLIGYDEQERENMINEKRKSMSHHIFEPEKWPLLEIAAFKISDKKVLLCISYDVLIMDAYSMDIIYKEMTALYNDSNVKLEELSITFRDYIMAYQEIKNSSIYMEDKKFWLDKIDEFPSAPELPLKINPLKIRNPHFTRKTKCFTRKELQKFKEVCRKHNLTLSVLFLTAYAQILSYWSNQTEFSINLTLFNRLPLHKEVERIVGDFTSLLLIDVHLEKMNSFWEKAQKIQETLMEALAHRNFDGIDFLREVSSRKNLGNRALMPVVFTSALFGDEFADSESEEGGQFEGGTGNISQTSQVFLDNQVGLINGNLVINWDYVSELFDEDIIEQMFEQYIALIASSVTEQKNVVLPVLSKADQEKIAQYNSTEEEIPEKTLHGLFVEAAQKYPNRIAIETYNNSITYKELDDASRKVSIYLRNKDVYTGDLVGVSGKKEIGTIINILGILRSGAGYVAVDPEYPQNRIDYIKEDCRWKLFLDSDFFEKLEKEPVVNTDYDEIANPDSTAYVIYTSGSTGKPKGVMLSHGSVCNTIIDINRKFNVVETDKILAVSSLCFDLSVYDIFGAFGAGACLVLLKEQKNIEQMLDVVVQQKITVWNSVPAIMERMIAEAEKRKAVQVYSSLRLVLLSGDWIPVNLPEKIRQYFNESEVVSLGGATEASIWSIYYPIKQVNPEWVSIPYGMPLANQKFYILNSDMELCPIEVVGELYIGGAGVAEGYQNNIEKTREVFIRHPELGYIYKTGDYGVLHKNGLIEFMGRKDRQVKIGGYRIEIGEIEAQLLTCDNVKSAVVLAKEIEEQKLTAFIVPVCMPENRTDFINNCRVTLSKNLPEYMIPQAFIVLDQIPLTHNSKVNVKKLIQMKVEQTRYVTEHAEPFSETEKKIVAIFKEVFEVSDIGVLDNFFDMGINSLQLTKLSKIIGEVFNKKIPILSMYEYSNISMLADYVNENERIADEETNENKVKILNRGRERIKQRNQKRKEIRENE